jgi:hypothetical protein
MNSLAMADALVSSHICEVRGQATRCRTRAGHCEPRPGKPRRPQPWATLRSRLGFALAETGLR